MNPFLIPQLMPFLMGPCSSFLMLQMFELIALAKVCDVFPEFRRHLNQVKRAYQMINLNTYPMIANEVFGHLDCLIPVEAGLNADIDQRFGSDYSLLLTFNSNI